MVITKRNKYLYALTCCILALFICVMPVLQTTVNAFLSEAALLTLAKYGFWAAASVLASYELATYNGYFGTGNSDFSDAINGLNYEFWHGYGDVIGAAFDAGRVILSSSKPVFDALMSRIRNFFGVIKGKFVKAYGQPNGLDILDSQDDLNFLNVSDIAEFSRSELDAAGWYPQFDYMCGNYQFRFHCSGRNSLTSYCEIYNTTTGEKVKHINIGPDYGSYGNLKLSQPVYCRDTGYIYLHIQTTQYGFDSYATFPISDLSGKSSGDTPPVAASMAGTGQKNMTGTYGGEENDYFRREDTPIATAADSSYITFSLPDDLSDIQEMTDVQIYDRILDWGKNGDLEKGVAVVNVPGIDTPTDAATYIVDTNVPVYDPDNVDPQKPNTLSLPRLMLTKFPFCLPFDLFNLVSTLNEPGTSFRIDIPVNFAAANYSHTFSLDFSQFEDAAQIFRFFVVLLFCVGLILITKNMMF